MIAEIASALQSTKVISDLLEAHRTLTNFDEISTAVYEQKIKLMAAVDLAIAGQEKQVALAQEIADLKKENEQLKNWDREKERYTRTDAAPGIPAYVLKEEMEKGGSLHPLCASCFEHREKFYLSYGPPMTPGLMICSHCKTYFYPAGQRGRQASAAGC